MAYNRPIYLSPAFREKVWGGNYIKEAFGFDTPSDHTGEAWLISAYKDDQSVVLDPSPYAGMGLRDLYDAHPELFGEPHPERFPLLVKLLDAKDDLSVQVHPGDDYALEHEDDLGKTESWYIMDTKPGTTLVYGHNAETKAQFDQMVDDGEWDKLLRHVPVQKDDFYYVPSGTIHALEAGTAVIETQQSSDVTYRVYDYDRPDTSGQLRELHLDDAKAVTNVPDQLEKQEPMTTQIGDSKLTQLVDATYFSVYKAEIHGETTYDLPENYYLLTVVEGEGELMIDGESTPLQLSDSLILPTDVTEATITGNLTIIASHPNFKAE